MTSRLSVCHLAEVMSGGPFDEQHELDGKCSFCGKECDLLDGPWEIGYDIELTLRRWKDDDCTTGEMLDRLMKEQERIYNNLIQICRKQLQKNKKPKSRMPYYKLNFETMRWERQ